MMISFIDRLAAIWQELHPGDQYWFDHPFPDDDPPTEPLHPFHKAESGPGADYNSNDTRDWKNMLYQYEITEVKPDELNPDGSVNQEKHAARINADLNQLYATTRLEVFDGAREHVKGVENDYIINVVYNR
jgi:hypothetical protein